MWLRIIIGNIIQIKSQNLCDDFFVIRGCGPSLKAKLQKAMIQNFSFTYSIHIDTTFLHVFNASLLSLLSVE